MNPDTNEHRKFVDTAVLSRELEAAIGRLRMALFWGFIGPLAGALLGMLKIHPGKLVVYGILATAPLSILLLIIYFVKLPAEAKTSRAALTILILTPVAAVANFIVAHYFSLLKV